MDFSIFRPFSQEINSKFLNTCFSSSLSPRLFFFFLFFLFLPSLKQQESNILTQSFPSASRLRPRSLIVNILVLDGCLLGGSVEDLLRTSSVSDLVFSSSPPSQHNSSLDTGNIYQLRENLILVQPKSTYSSTGWIQDTSTNWQNFAETLFCYCLKLIIPSTVRPGKLY